MSATNNNKHASNHQLQPFYYYTANGQVQVGYPQQMLAGLYQQQHGNNQQGKNGFPYAMPFYYNNAAFLQSAEQMANMQRGAPVVGVNAMGANHHKKSGIKKEQSMQKNKRLVKKMVQAQPSSNSESSDHGVHLRRTNTTESHSEHGNNSCEGSDSNKCDAANNLKSELATLKVSAVKPKKSKPPKPCKKVICVDLPEDLQSIETVTNRFQQYGEILLVRVLKPGKVMPFDLKVYSGKIHDLGSSVCAIIEFETPLAATNAVNSEKSNLRLAALQQGASVALYGSVDNDNNSKAHSEHSSEHTHGESGIHQSSYTISRSMGSSSHSNHDDMSHDSHDDFEDQHIEQQQRKRSLPQPANNNFLPNFKPRSSFCRGTTKNLLIEVNDKNKPVAHQKLVAEVSAVSTCETIKNVEIEKQPLSEQITAIPNPMCSTASEESEVEKKKAESKIISTNNGRITTAINITLTSSMQNNVICRSANKLDLTNSRYPKMINMRACDLLPMPSKPYGRPAGPGLLSDPSDEFLMENVLAKNVKKYSRDYLMSLKETRRASVFPTGMKNLPEIVPFFNNEI